MEFEQGKRLYFNPLASEGDVKDWRMEGRGKVTFADNRIHLENELDESLGDEANWVFWCPEDFPDRIMIEWEFYPIREPGLCMTFFAARGRDGSDLFDPGLPPRSGKYPEYHAGGIDALHLSYFRHKHPRERALRTCNLRKSYGFHMVAREADPLPPVEDAIPPYQIRLVKHEEAVQFVIRDLPVLEWEDDGTTYGPVYGGGKIGFRQMAPMKAAYANLSIHEAIRKG